MDHILDRLWLGSLEDAVAYLQGDLAAQPVPLRGILSLNEVMPQNQHPRDVLRHYHVPIPDEQYLPPDQWDVMLHILRELLDLRGTVLVHCRLGVSRAPSLVAAYLAACGHSATPEAALVHLVARRGCVNPHSETWRGVLAYWEQHA